MECNNPILVSSVEKLGFTELDMWPIVYESYIDGFRVLLSERCFKDGSYLRDKNLVSFRIYKNQKYITFRFSVKMINDRDFVLAYIRNEFKRLEGVPKSKE